MKIKCLLFAISLAVAGFAAEKVPCRTTVYETHLPKDVYLCCLKKNLLVEGALQNHWVKQTPQGKAILNINRDEDEKRYHVVIDYTPPIDEGWVRLLVAYQNRKLLAYVFFDKDGHDYVPAPPFTAEDERWASALLMRKILPLF